MQKRRWQVERRLEGGKSGATVELLVDPVSGEHSVRKKGFTSSDPNERDAFILDKNLFGGGAHLNPVEMYTSEDVCWQLAPYIDGNVFSELLLGNGEQILLAHNLRMLLVASMRRGGYFSQKHLQSAARFFSQYLFQGATKPMDVLDSLPGVEQRAICGYDLRSVLLDTVGFLLEEETLVPCGFYPVDLNASNIFSVNDTVQVIDQQLLFSSPAIIAAKLQFGWRHFATSVDEYSLSVLAAQRSHLMGNIPLISRLDQVFLEFFAEQFAWCDPDIFATILQQVHAIQLFRNIRGVLHYAVNTRKVSEQDVQDFISPFFRLVAENAQFLSSTRSDLKHSTR